MDPFTLRKLVCYDPRIVNDFAELENPDDDNIADEDLQFDTEIFSHIFFQQQPIPWGMTFKFSHWVIENHPPQKIPFKNRLLKL